MKRLPYAIALCITIWTIGLITPSLIVLWLLGAEKPFRTIIDAFDKIVPIKK
jgi:hypothetical protein